MLLLLLLSLSVEDTSAARGEYFPAPNRSCNFFDIRRRRTDERKWTEAGLDATVDPNCKSCQRCPAEYDPCRDPANHPNCQGDAHRRREKTKKCPKYVGHGGYFGDARRLLSPSQGRRVLALNVSEPSSKVRASSSEWWERPLRQPRPRLLQEPAPTPQPTVDTYSSLMVAMNDDFQRFMMNLVLRIGNEILLACSLCFFGATLLVPVVLWKRDAPTCRRLRGKRWPIYSGCCFSIIMLGALVITTYMVVTAGLEVYEKMDVNEVQITFINFQKYLVEEYEFLNLGTIERIQWTTPLLNPTKAEIFIEDMNLDSNFLQMQLSRKIKLDPNPLHKKPDGSNDDLANWKPGVFGCLHFFVERWIVNAITFTAMDGTRIAVQGRGIYYLPMDLSLSGIWNGENFKIFFPINFPISLDEVKMFREDNFDYLYAILLGLNENAFRGESFIDPDKFWVRSPLWDALTFFRVFLACAFALLGLGNAILCAACCIRCKDRCPCKRRNGYRAKAATAGADDNLAAPVPQQLPPGSEFDVKPSQSIAGFQMDYDSLLNSTGGLGADHIVSAHAVEHAQHEHQHSSLDYSSQHDHDRGGAARGGMPLGQTALAATTGQATFGQTSMVATHSHAAGAGVMPHGQTTLTAITGQVGFGQNTVIATHSHAVIGGEMACGQTSPAAAIGQAGCGQSTMVAPHSAAATGSAMPGGQTTLAFTTGQAGLGHNTMITTHSHAVTGGAVPCAQTTLMATTGQAGLVQNRMAVAHSLAGTGGAMSCGKTTLATTTGQAGCGQNTMLATQAHGVAVSATASSSSIRYDFLAEAPRGSLAGSPAGSPTGSPAGSPRSKPAQYYVHGDYCI